jgi:hypothetical protein
MPLPACLACSHLAWCACRLLCESGLCCPDSPMAACRGRRGLEVLQACAQLLMREIGTESLASGLEVSVQVGGKQGWVWHGVACRHALSCSALPFFHTARDLRDASISDTPLCFRCCSGWTAG